MKEKEKLRIFLLKNKKVLKSVNLKMQKLEYWNKLIKKKVIWGI